MNVRSCVMRYARRSKNSKKLLLGGVLASHIQASGCPQLAQTSGNLLRRMVAMMTVPAHTVAPNAKTA